MNNKYVQISVKSNGYNLDGSQALYGPSAPPDLRGTPIVNFDVSGSGVEFGDGVVLTAAHLFDGVAIGSLGPVEFKSISSSVEEQAASSPVYLEIWNAQNAFAGIQAGDPMPDLAYVKTSLSITPSDLSPVMVFADQNAANRELSSDGTIQAYGAKSQGETDGQFSSIVAPGIFAATNITQSGDSGGPAYVTKDGISYVVGIDSYGSVDETKPGSKFSYLNVSDYDKISSGLSSSDFSAMRPDLIVGSDNKEVIRGSKRKADIITNGDDDVILAASGGGLVNTGAGENDTVFLPTAVGGADPGTTVVMSPGDKTIVGGGANDKLVVPLDRLWTKAGGAPTSSSLSDNGQTVQLMGGLYNANYETNGFTEGGWDTSESIAGQSGSTDPLSWQDADYNLGASYELVDGNLQVRVTASDPSQAKDPVVWQSELTIVDYHTGDFGLTFKPFSDAGPVDYSNLDAWYQKSYQTRLSDELSLTAQPVASNDVDDDTSSTWDNGQMGSFKPVDPKAIASALASVEGDTDIPTGSLPPTSGANLNITQDDTEATLDGGGTANVTGNRDTVTATGSDSTIDFGGTGETATISDGSVNLQAGSDARISGDGNVVTMADRSGLTLSGNTNAVTISGTAGMVDDLGDGNSVALQGSGNTLTLEGTNAIVSGAGTGNDITLQQGGDAATTTACALTLWSDVTATVAGGYDSVYLDARDDLSVTGLAQQILLGGNGNSVDDTGSGDAFELLGSGNTLTLGGTDAAVSGTGTGNDITLQRGGDTVTTTACALTLWSDVAAAVAGDHDSVYLDARDDLSVTGVAQQVVLGGNGNSVDDTGSGDAFQLLGSGNTLTLEGTNATVFGTGTGNTVTLSGSGRQLTLDGSADIVAQGGNQTFVFTPTAGTTTVTGFDATDTLQFSSAQFSDWQSLLGHASQQGADTVIRADPSHSLTLAGVTLSTLDRNHVQFA